jgi:cyanate permease
MGAQWTGVVLIAASGPLLVGVIRDTTGGYGVSFAVLSVFFLIASGVILASGHVKPSHTVHGSTPSKAKPNARD